VVFLNSLMFHNFALKNHFGTSNSLAIEAEPSLQKLSQCRSKGKISRGHARRAARGVLEASPQKCRNLEAWKCYSQRSPRAICDLRISRINYFLHCLSKPMHIEESRTLATSITNRNRLSLYLETSKCFTLQSHYRKFIVSSISGPF